MRPVQDGPWLYPLFPASCPCRVVHRSPDVVDGGILAMITKAASGAFELKSIIRDGSPPLSAPGLIKITG